MRLLTAIGVSAAIHAALAAGIAAYLCYAPGPEVVVTLDVGSVELSFAEEEQDSAARIAASAGQEAVEERLPLPVEGAAPEMVDSETGAMPPMTELAELPVPESEKPSLTMPPRREEAQSAGSEALPAPRTAKIEAPPTPRRNIRPDYPRGARQRAEEGKVTLEMKISSRGEVESVQVVDSPGFADLEDAAIKAVKAARFNPARAGGKAVESVARITLEFKLK